MPDSDVLDRLFGKLATADVQAPAVASVVARGRQRRRRARGRNVIAAAAVAAIVVGATQLPRIHEAASSVPQQARNAVCAAAPDAALNSELRHALPASRQQSVSVFGVSPDGTVLYLMTTTADFQGIAAESVATGAISQVIMPGRVPWFSQVQGGLGPDGEVVARIFNAAAQTHGSEFWSSVLVFSPRTIAWSASGNTAVLHPVGQTEPALSAPVFAGPDHQLVAWESAGPAAQGVDVSNREIVEANLLTGVTAVVASGNVGAPVFVGSALVWPVASSAAPAHLVAVSASAFPARQPVPVPLPLRKAGAGALLVSAGGATAYASSDRTKLFYSPSLSQPARQVLALPRGSHLARGGLTPAGLIPAGLAVGPGYLAWNTSSGASFVASAKTLAAARITDGGTTWGPVQGLGGYVLASRSSRPESVSHSLYLLSGSVIDGLACARQ